MNPFEYVRPNERGVELIKNNRAACRALYDVLLTLPESRERSIAITKLEEVSMWANKCISFLNSEEQA